MAGHKTLVVYYSRTGNTRRVAEALASALDAQVDALVDVRDRRGLLGYLSASVSGILGQRTSLRGELHDPSVFDLVVIGTPLWNGGVSAAVRSYLSSYWSRLPEVAFFATCSTTDCARAFDQMKQLADRDPEGLLRVTEAQLRSGSYETAANAFAERLGTHLSMPVRHLPVTPSDAAPPPGM